MISLTCLEELGFKGLRVRAWDSLQILAVPGTREESTHDLAGIRQVGKGLEQGHDALRSTHSVPGVQLIRMLQKKDINGTQVSKATF